MMLDFGSGEFFCKLCTFGNQSGRALYTSDQMPKAHMKQTRKFKHYTYVSFNI